VLTPQYISRSPAAFFWADFFYAFNQDVASSESIECTRIHKAPKQHDRLFFIITGIKSKSRKDIRRNLSVIISITSGHNLLELPPEKVSD
jgi:hypothetical protein